MGTIRTGLRRGTGTLLAAALVLLAACGGDDYDRTGAAAAVPAQAGGADIGPAGGSVSAVFAGGTTVTLTVPADALATTTTIRIDPAVAPANVIGAMTLSPAGLQFRTPATLSVTLPAGTNASDTLVAFGIDGATVPIGAIDPVTRTLTIDLRYLGVGAAAPAIAAAGFVASPRKAALAASAPAAPTILLFVQLGDLASAATLWHQSVANLAASATRDNAVIAQEGFAALVTLPMASASQTLKDIIASDATTWRNVVCDQLTSSIAALNAFDFAGDYAGYAQRALDALAWGTLMQDLKPLADRTGFIHVLACPALQIDVSTPVRTSFAHFLEAATRELGRLSPSTDFDVLLDTRLRQLIVFEGALRTFGGIDDLAEQVKTLAGEQTKRLRQAAYDECRLQRSQARQKTLLTKETGDASFEATSPFAAGDLQADIELCGMAIGWELRDAQGTVLQSGTAGGSGNAGTFTPTATLQMGGAEKLVLTGPLSALRCPSGNANNEQLGFAAGPLGGGTTALPSLTPANDNGYLEASSLELSVAQLKSLAQVVGPNDGELDVQRTGGTCNGEFPNFSAHRRIVRFELVFLDVQIDTAALARGRVGAAYSQTLAASGGTAPYTWTATGLPAGLALDAATGVISGTPTTAGSASVTLRARSADNITGQRTLSLTIDAAAVAYSGTITERIEQPGFTACSNGVCTTSTRSDLNTYVVRLELQRDDSFVASGTITLRSRAQQSRDDGCNFAQSTDESGRVTAYTGELPRPTGILSGPVTGTRTESATTCASGGGFTSTTSTSHTAVLELKLGVAYEFSGDTLTAITYQHQVFDVTTGTTSTTSGRLTLGQ